MNLIEQIKYFYQIAQVSYYHMKLSNLADKMRRVSGYYIEICKEDGRIIRAKKERVEKSLLENKANEKKDLSEL